MQQKNLIAFMIVSVLILVAWMWMQQALFPPRQKEDKAAAIEKKDKDAGKKPADERANIWSKLSPQEKNALLIAQAVASPALLPLAVRQFPEQFLAKAPAPKQPEKAPETYTLGGEGFFLAAKLTSHGAGVEQVTLNRFEGADRLGLPTHEKLHLVPEDPFMPSFLLYHYLDPSDRENVFRPVDVLGRKTWKYEGRVDAEDAQEVRFSIQVPPPFSHLTITKTYRLTKGAYHIGMSLEIKSAAKPGVALPAFRYQLASGHGLPIEGEWYTNTYRNSFIGLVRNNSLFPNKEDAARISGKEGGDRVPQDQRGDAFVQYAGVYNQYFASLIVVDDKQPSPEDGGVDMKDILAYARPTLEATEKKGALSKIAPDESTVSVEIIDTLANGVRGHKLVTFDVVPYAREDLKHVKVNDAVVVRWYRDDRGRFVAMRIRAAQQLRPAEDDITVRAVSEPVEVEPGKKVVHNFLLYHGPIKIMLLGQMGKDSPDPALIERYADTLHLRRLTDHGNFSWWSDLIIACTNLMHWLLHKLHVLIHFVTPGFLSYGLSIILLTVVVRGAMFPISRKQAYLSMRMQELAPELKKVQEKYKTDPKGKNEAVMELYRKHNVHPLGGCLPLLLQLPIFMGLYYALQESIHFRLQPFLWIRNLAAPDMLVWWGEKIPLISDPDNQSGSLFSMLYLGPYLSILPIIAVVLMLVQQKMLTPPPTDEQQEMNQKVMKYMMIVIGVMFYKVAAGLCLYFIASSLWGVAERKLLPKKKGPALATATTGGKPPPTILPRKGRGAAKKEIKKPDGAVQKVKDWWADLLEQARKK
jgi:YidC/Oxa1 family membrane protein insertase